MADFPALRPVARRYGLAVYPVTHEAGFAGGGTRFLHDYPGSGQLLELEFEGLTLAQLQLIRDHYRGQQGGLLAFALSAEAWAGNTSIPPELGPWPVFWKYAAPLEEDAPRGGIGGVRVRLEAVR